MGGDGHVFPLMDFVASDSEAGSTALVALFFGAAVPNLGAAARPGLHRVLRTQYDPYSYGGVSTRASSRMPCLRCKAS